MSGGAHERRGRASAEVITRVAAALGRDPAEVERGLRLARSGRADLIKDFQAGRLSLDEALRLARGRPMRARASTPPVLTAPAPTSSSHERLQNG
jgi:hypothetical protein